MVCQDQFQKYPVKLLYALRLTFPATQPKYLDVVGCMVCVQEEYLYEYKSSSWNVKEKILSTYIISNSIVLRICAKILKKVCAPVSISSVARSQLRVARWRTRRKCFHPLGETTPLESIWCCKVSFHTLWVLYILQSETTWRLLNGRATSWWVYLG